MSLIQGTGGGLGGAGAPGGALGSFYSHTLDQSLKFHGLSRLSHTFSAGNQKTYTFSAWLKRTKVGVTYEYIFHTNNAGASAGSYLYFYNDNLVFFDNGVTNFVTNRLFRDVSSWYHVVLAVDTSDSTEANRTKLYVNGVQETSFSTTPAFGLNRDTFFNSAIDHFISSTTSSVEYKGYMAEINFIDGTQLTPSSFGETKDGIWIPKAYSGSYGTNGFHLPFSFTEGNSVEFDGVGDNISWSNATQYDIATDDDFCLEFFMKADIEANWAYGFGDYTNANWVLQLGPNGIPYLYYPGGSITFSDMSAYITTTDWHHIALVRESGTHRFYVDGVQRSTSTSFGTTAVNMAHFDVGDGHTGGGGAAFKGTLSNLRFTVGAARYGSGTTFTVPTSTLTNDSSNVKLLAFTNSTITADASTAAGSEEHTSELQSRLHLVCRLLLEKKKTKQIHTNTPTQQKI